MAANDAVAVIDLAVEACTAYGRDDLLPRLAAARQRLVSPSVRVLVVGEFKQGKSTLVNALVGEDICPVDDDITTSVPTAVAFATARRAVAWYATDDGDGARSEVIAVDGLAEFVSEIGNPSNERRLGLVEVGVPSPILEPGLILVDTPGVGGLGSAHGAVTIAALPTADAVLLVTDAGQELTAPEIRFLANARELSPVVAVVLTKRDLYPAWRQVRDRDRDHLDANGFTRSPLYTVASPLATRDGEESGIAGLAELLGDLVAAGADLQRWAAGYAVHEVARHLEATLLSSRDGLADPGSATELTVDLERVQDRANRLRAESARWQVTLHDGLADVTSDVDHDLRRRLRAITGEVDERIEDGDPADWWEEFQSWLRQRVADEVTASYVVLAGRAEELAERVAEHFAAAEDTIDIGADATPPLPGLEALAPATPELAGVVAGVRARTSRATATGLTAIRGSYGGFTMFGMLGGMLGFTAMNPALVGVTMLMGRKSVREEKARQLGQRRQQARSVAHRYLDEVSFQVGKDLRDATRRAVRQLRDGFTARAEELQRTATERVEAARRAALTAEEEREARLADVEAELSRVRALAGKGDELLAGSGG